MKTVHGHSKDLRPDLKQFMVKMLCVDRTIPVFGAVEDGNTSDKIANNEVLTPISKYMADNGIKKEGFIYIAVLSLLVWRLIEYNMRRYAQENEKDLPGWKKRKTKKSITVMMMTRFQYMMILMIDQSRRFNRLLTQIQREYLKALTLSPEIFTNPNGWKVFYGLKYRQH